jgi:hypothetical protein
VSSVQNEGLMNYTNAVNFCKNKGTGWRLPTSTELGCLCNNLASLPGGATTDVYWGIDKQSGCSTHMVVELIECASRCAHKDSNSAAVKCVRD